MLPFLTYVTVFRSRLGLNTTVLRLTSFAHQPEVAVLRRLRRVVEERVPLALDDEANSHVFNHLVNKRLISRRKRKTGRYIGLNLREKGDRWQAERDGEDLTELPVYTVDRQMAHPDVRSTIGAPTPDNVEEVLDLARQLRLVSKAKNTWTAAGHAAHALRRLSAPHLADGANPFLLGAEGLVFLRQVLEADGLLLREVVREVVNAESVVTRDDLAGRFGKAVGRTLEALKDVKVGPLDAQEARSFGDLIAKTARKRSEMTRAPGVLEHRVSPRLEWLVDLGYLEKRPGARNRFEYLVGADVKRLLQWLDSKYGEKEWAGEVAAVEWMENSIWERLRSRLAVFEGVEGAVREAYKLIRRDIGPVPLRELTFLTMMLRRDEARLSQIQSEIIELAKQTEGVSLSGGRYSRSPENVYITDSALGR